jgi:hypothetical protein
MLCVHCSLFIAVYSGKTPHGANRSKAGSITQSDANFKPIRNPILDADCELETCPPELARLWRGGFIGLKITGFCRRSVAV